jgi:hypothetical protein
MERPFVKRELRHEQKIIARSKNQLEEWSTVLRRLRIVIESRKSRSGEGGRRIDRERLFLTKE